MKAYDLVKEIEATLHRREKSRVWLHADMLIISLNTDWSCQAEIIATTPDEIRFGCVAGMGCVDE